MRRQVFGFVKRYKKGLLNLIFPRTCISCSSSLLEGENTVCYRCISQLEPSRYGDYLDNEIVHLFDGKIPISFGSAGFLYHKGGILQKLIFQLKYYGHKEIGKILGREVGYSLKNTPFESVDWLIPVPLHLKKQRARGYNQAEWIALGIGEVLNKPVRTDILQRIIHTDTQTQKSRMQRFDNMKDVFSVSSDAILNGKHLLLIDDVVTTGGTLLSCAEALQNNSNEVKISIVCLAKADS